MISPRGGVSQKSLKPLIMRIKRKIHRRFIPAGPPIAHCWYRGPFAPSFSWFAACLQFKMRVVELVADAFRLPKVWFIWVDAFTCFTNQLVKSNKYVQDRPPLSKTILTVATHNIWHSWTIVYAIFSVSLFSSWFSGTVCLIWIYLSIFHLYHLRFTRLSLVWVVCVTSFCDTNWLTIRVLPRLIRIIKKP
jgi:hypothetical protein